MVSNLKQTLRPNPCEPHPENLSEPESCLGARMLRITGQEKKTQGTRRAPPGRYRVRPPRRGGEIMLLFTLPLAGGSDAVAAGEGIYQQ